jgi:DNA-binding IclR family transcriptional regulator
MMVQVEDSRDAATGADATFPDIVGAQLLVRALKLLLYLRERDEPVTAADLGQHLEIPPSNVYRLVQTLELSGLVERSGRGRIALGLRFLDLGRALERRIDREVGPAALEAMQELTHETDETSLLTMSTGLNAICVLSVESSRPIRLSFASGRVLPLHAGASGKVLLPWLSPRVVEHLMRGGRSWRLANGQVLTPAGLQAQIEEIRSVGHVITFGEVDAEAAAVAAPVLPAGRLCGGLSVAGPAARFGDDRLPELIDKVRAAAEEIGRRMEKRRN